MNLRLLSLAAATSFCWQATAQTTQEAGHDPIVEALKKADGGAPKRVNEVSVVLEDDGQPLVPPAETKKPEAAPSAEPPQKPVLVTGKPPGDAELVSVAPGTAKDTEKGVSVRVETLQAGQTPIDPKQVKLLAPFPAKPLSTPPSGWIFETTGGPPPFLKEVEIAPGTRVTLSIRPHLLTPIADGSNLFNLQEPGFDPNLGYQQTTTVGSILSTSIDQLDEDSKRLGVVIDRLQQLLISLPPTESARPPLENSAAPAKVLPISPLKTR
jgi:hypothetical protein